MRKFLMAAMATAFLLTGVARVQAAEPIRALLVIGGCCHDYKAQKDILAKGLPKYANVVVTIAYDPSGGTNHLNPVYEKADWAKGYDVVIHDECSADVKDLAVIDRILKPHRDGVPAVLLHCAMHCYRSQGWPKATTPWFEFSGLATTGHGAQIPIAVKFTDQDNPIVKGMDDWTTIREELYNNAHGKLEDSAHALAQGTQTYKKGGQEHADTTIVAWTNVYNGKTKVFGTTLGHNNETVADPRYMKLVARGLLWSTGHLNADGTPAAGYGPAK